MGKLVCASLVLLLSLPVLAHSQQPGPPPSVSSPTQLEAPYYSPPFDSLEGLIHLDVMVTDKSGKPATGLAAKDFTLTDNGQPQKLLSLHAVDGTNSQLESPEDEVVLVLDKINLSPDQATTAERELNKYLLRNSGHLAHPVSIYLFSTAGLAVTTLVSSTDGNALANQIADKKQMRALWPDANFTWLERLSGIRRIAYLNTLSLQALGTMVIEERRRPGRKQMLWIGYGWPVGASCQQSFDFITEFSTRLREARITLSSISAWPNPYPSFLLSDYLAGVKSEKQQNPFSLALQVLVAQTGGRVVNSTADLASTIENIAAPIGSYYTISFDPPRTELVDEYHELKVQLANPELQARTNTGYYDEPAFYDQPSAPLDPLTGAQLEKLVEGAHTSLDGSLAKKLSGLALTERISSSSLPTSMAHMPGEKSRAALTVLADGSAFLGPSKEMTLATPAPDIAAQRQMLSKTLDYLGKTIPRLPNFFAIRSTTRYREPLQKEGVTWKSASGDRLLHLTGSSTATVLYRNGYDVADYVGQKGKNSLAEQKLNEMDLSAFGASANVRAPKGEERGMNTKGTFGPILSTVILDAAHSTITWGGWEQGSSGAGAVFRYVVPEEKSHYEVTYCCLTEGDGTTVFRRLSGYHGEIRIDPDTGAILRLTVEADLKPKLPIFRSDILVEYAPQEIGGTTYICPVRSVSIWRGRRGEMVHEWGESFRVYGPFETMLDDVTFSQYHLFRGEARILTGDESPPQ